MAWCWWMKNFILDNENKALEIQCSTTPVEELHITSNWYNRRTWINWAYDLWNFYGASDWINLATVVPAPWAWSCWKKEVTSISVYNPNASAVLFYIVEHDYENNTVTIIDEKLLNGYETWTNECICTCCPCSGWVSPTPTWDCPNRYYHGQLLWASCDINILWDCIWAYLDADWHVNIQFQPVMTWWGCDWDDAYNLTICWTTVNLSCLANNPIAAYENDNLLSSDINGICIEWKCLVASVDANWIVHYDFNQWMQLDFDCDTWILKLCESSVDLSCLRFGWLSFKWCDEEWNNISWTWITTLIFDCCPFYLSPIWSDLWISFNFNEFYFDTNTYNLYLCDKLIADLSPLYQTPLTVVWCDPYMNPVTFVQPAKLTFDCCSFITQADQDWNPVVSLNWKSFWFNCDDYFLYFCDEAVADFSCLSQFWLRVTWCNSSEVSNTYTWVQELDFNCCAFNVTQVSSWKVSINIDASAFHFDCNNNKLYLCNQEISDLDCISWVPITTTWCDNLGHPFTMTHTAWFRFACCPFILSDNGSNVVDIDFDYTSFDFDCDTWKVTLCWRQILDLSCLINPAVLINAYNCDATPFATDITWIDLCWCCVIGTSQDANWVAHYKLWVPVSRSWCTWSHPYQLTICDQTIDLSCLHDDVSCKTKREWCWEWLWSECDNIKAINFCWCCVENMVIDATWVLNVSFKVPVSRSWCTWDDPYKLKICDTVVDLSCLAWGWTDPVYYHTAFVTPTWDDATWQLENPHKPFKSIAAAWNAINNVTGLLTTDDWMIDVYPWKYGLWIWTTATNMSLRCNISLYLHDWVTLMWSLHVVNNLASIEKFSISWEWVWSLMDPNNITSLSNFSYYTMLTIAKNIDFDIHLKEFIWFLSWQWSTADSNTWMLDIQSKCTWRFVSDKTYIYAYDSSDTWKNYWNVVKIGSSWLDISLWEMTFQDCSMTAVTFFWIDNTNAWDVDYYWHDTNVKFTKDSANKKLVWLVDWVKANLINLEMNNISMEWRFTIPNQSDFRFAPVNAVHATFENYKAINVRFVINDFYFKQTAALYTNLQWVMYNWATQQDVMFYWSNTIELVPWADWTISWYTIWWAETSTNWFFVNWWIYSTWAHNYSTTYSARHVHNNVDHYVNHASFVRYYPRHSYRGA